MATVTHAGTAVWTTTAGNKTLTATPALNDLIVVIAPATGVATSAVTDNNADGLGTYTKIGSSFTGWSTSGDLSVWVRNALIGSATSTVFTAAQASSTGGGLDVFRVSGMSYTGAAAVRQSAGQSSGTSGTTPAPVLGAAALTGNPLIGAACCGTNASTNFTPRTSWTEASDLGYTTPASGMETMSISSGETGTTMTWGSTAPSAFASVVIELIAGAPETSPSLELSGFAISGPGPLDTINSVTVAVTEHQSAAIQAPCTFELWDYSGTPAKIGATQAGTASTGTGNVSSATFTGVTYPMLATLRVRVYGNAPSGSSYVESVDAVSLVVNYTPGPAVQPVLGSGRQVLPAAARPVPPQVITSPVPGSAASAILATGAGAALNAAVSTGVPGTANAVLATGTGTAQNPAITAAASVTAGLAAGSGAAQAAVPGVSVRAAVAAGTGAAQPPGAAATGGPGPAVTQSEYTAFPVLRQIPPQVITAASTAAQGTADAVLAAGTGAAQGALAAISVNAGAATGAGAAQNPAIAGTVSVNAVLATGAGAAQGPVPAIGASAAAAAGTGTAQSPAAAIGVKALVAAGTGAALNASVPGGAVTISSADSARAAESAFYYITGTGDAGHAAESAQIRVRSTDKAAVADAPLNAWPATRDAGKAADKPASAWPAGDDTARAAERVLSFRFAGADTAHMAEVLHEMGIWTYIPVNLRLLGRLWRITGMDEHGGEVTVAEGGQLTGAMLELAERVSWSRVVRRASSADSVSAAERLSRPLVAVTCWAQPAVSVTVTVAEVPVLALR